MSARPQQRRHSARDLETILGVTSALAAPFDLMTMLAEVVSAAKQVLNADRGSVWLYDPAADELVLEVATGIRPGARAGRRRAWWAPARATARSSTCPTATPTRGSIPASTRAPVIARAACSRLPLVDHKDVLVGVMQVLNKAGGGVFDDHDEALATALAAQCAVALQRVRMTEAVIEGEKMRQELEMARVVQMSTLAREHARAARLRRLRHVQAGRAHRRRHVRSGACSTRGCWSCWAMPPATASPRRFR